MITKFSEDHEGTNMLMGWRKPGNDVSLSLVLITVSGS